MDGRKCVTPHMHSSFNSLHSIDDPPPLTVLTPLTCNACDWARVAIGNFKIEPPGLFQGRGEHPKMGKLKHRVQPEDVIINISNGAPVPESPAGHKWKEVRHDNKVHAGNSLGLHGRLRWTGCGYCFPLLFKIQLPSHRSFAPNSPLCFSSTLGRCLGLLRGQRTSRARTNTSCLLQTLTSR